MASQTTFFRCRAGLSRPVWVRLAPFRETAELAAYPHKAIRLEHALTSATQDGSLGGRASALSALHSKV